MGAREGVRGPSEEGGRGPSEEGGTVEGGTEPELRSGPSLPRPIHCIVIIDKLQI